MRPALCALLLLVVACGNRSLYPCSASDQCVDGAGTMGTCEAEGFCSFPDTECPSGNRFEPNAGNGLAGVCVGPGGGGCGTMGNACCAGDVCGANLFCSAGTCGQCITDVALGNRHSCFLEHDGTIWCSGQNDEGELGNGGSSVIPTATPAQVRDTMGPIQDAIALGAGDNTSCAIRADKTAWCWGENGNCTDGGQVGDGTTSDRELATQVLRASDNQPLTNIVEIHGAFCQTCARDDAGGVWCWGDGDGGRLGDGTVVSHNMAAPVLTAVAGAPLTGVDELAVGDRHECVRKGDAVSCWGVNDHGQVGNGTIVDQPTPTQILTGITSLAVGRFHSCAAKTDGTMVCWGQGNQGRLGNGLGDKDAGDVLDQKSPGPVLVALGGAPFGGVASVAAGALSCALMADKTVECWGINLYGQTGTGVGSYVPAPVLEASGKPLKNVARLVAEFHRACAFGSDGSFACWGRNSEGEFGDGTFVNHGLATPVGPSCQ